MSSFVADCRRPRWPLAFSHRCARLLLVAAVLAGTVPSASAIILFRTGSASENRTEPTGALAGSGWQFQGQFGGFLATPIGPKHFISAAHIGTADSVIVFRGVTYPLTPDATSPAGQLQRYVAHNVPGTDLLIHQIQGTFPAFAPMWTAPGAEVGKPLVVFGRGTLRGDPVSVPDGSANLRGWAWAGPDGNQRWGTNVVAAAVDGGPSVGTLLYATFDQGGGVEEAHLSVGDSGGGVFIQDPVSGVWMLAAINYAVDGDLYRKNTPNTAESPNPPFTAALFDTAGLFQFINDAYVPTTGPTGFYSTPVANHLPYINVVLQNSPLVKIGPDVIFGFASEGGKRYLVERCDDLAVGDWTTVTNNLAGTGGTLLVTDPSAASLARRFYRVVSLR